MGRFEAIEFVASLSDSERVSFEHDVQEHRRELLKNSYAGKITEIQDGLKHAIMDMQAAHQFAMDINLWDKDVFRWQDVMGKTVEILETMPNHPAETKELPF